MSLPLSLTFYFNDKFFVKHLYPSFTPTVFLFVAGTVAYGVLKYQQDEQVKDEK
jgi:hypothetical protein